MLQYLLAVTCTLIISAILISLIFKKSSIINFKIILSVTLASLILACALPGIYYIISKAAGGSIGYPRLLLFIAAALLVYIVIAIALSRIISQAFLNHAGNEDAEAPKTHVLESIAEQAGILDSGLLETVLGKGIQVDAAADERVIADDNEGTASCVAADTQQAESWEDKTEEAAWDSESQQAELWQAGTQENTYDAYDEGTQSAAESEGAYLSENDNVVDSVENIDKMCIESQVYDSEILTVEDCINEAFRLKVQNDLEGAILYYMYALDKKPDRELEFLIVLDICALYKSLGQKEIAIDILNSYNNVFADMMDGSVRREIENNLSND